MDRKMRQFRSHPTDFKTREEDTGDLYIEGYFSVFNSDYELWPGCTESIAPKAFSHTLDGDIRALVDHETRLVLGRNTAGTLELKEDEKGLWGRIKINREDQDAMNLYARVQRGDVNQCSFGFDILDEDFQTREDGDNHWIIREVELYEVSVVTFPAYTDTSVAARKRDWEQIQKRKMDLWRETCRLKLKHKED